MRGRIRSASLAGLAAGLLFAGCAPRPAGVAPPLVSADPAPESEAVVPSAWIRLRFEGPVSFNARRAVELRCGGVRLDAAVHALAADSVLVNPAPELPPASRCDVTWRGREGAEGFAFRTAASAGPPAVVRYDRTDPATSAPFPDDFWRREEGDTAHVDVRLATFDLGAGLLVDALRRGVSALDGFSPIGHLVVALSEAPDPASLPHTPDESVDPLASVGLFDLSPGSPAFGERVPFQLEARSDTSGGRTDHTLLLFPSTNLRTGGRYGIVVTRRLLAPGGRSFEPSDFFRRVRDGDAVGPAAEAVATARPPVLGVLQALERASRLPIPREDVALAVRFTVRERGRAPADLLAMREDVFAAPPPAIVVERVRPEPEDTAVAAVVRGTWEAPEWRDRRRLLTRDAAGRPRLRGVRPVRFELALPRAAREGRVPVVMYQHGNPGSAQAEIVLAARSSLAEAGFAVIGFTDVLNRGVSPRGQTPERRAHDQVTELLLRLMQNGELPDHFVQTNGEQLAFLRAIGEISRIDRFRGAGGDYLFGIDPAAPITYVGVSEGAHHAPAFLAVAPEVRAAVLVAGGRRFSEVLLHQKPETFFAPLHLLGFSRFSPTDLWVALALFQSLFDDQDPANYARYLYREPLPVAGDEDGRRASLLLVEGIGDSFVPNHVTESLARALGPVAQVEPILRRVPFLEAAPAPLAGNVDARTTAGLVQYAPLGLPGMPPSPGCQSPPLSLRYAEEGHYCVQSAAESLRQRVVFLRTALTEEAPVIVDPLANEEPAQP